MISADRIACLSGATLAPLLRLPRAGIQCQIRVFYGWRPAVVRFFMKPDTIAQSDNRSVSQPHRRAHRAVCEPARFINPTKRTRDELYGGLRRNAPIAPPRSVTCHRGCCALPPNSLRRDTFAAAFHLRKSLRGCRTKNLQKLFYHGQ